MKYYRNKIKRLNIDRTWGNLKTAMFLAFKSIFRGNRWSLVLIILVMSFSFVNLVFVSSIISGVMKTMDNQIIDAVFSHVIISPEEDEYYIDQVSDIEQKIEQLSDVAGIAPHLSTTAFIEYKWKEKVAQSDKGESGTWEIVGIEPQKEMQVTTIHECMIEGTYLDENDRDEIILGVEIAGGEDSANPEFLTLGNVQVGDKVRLTFPNGVQREYTVKGIFFAQEMMRADQLAFITNKEMVSALGRTTHSDKASQILVRAEEGVNETALINELKSLGINGEIRSWQEYGAAMRGGVSTFDIIGGLIGGVGLIVAAAVMFIVIYINALNKKRQIGILRAIGIPQNSTIISYLFQALFYVFVGIIVGWIIVQFGLQPYFLFRPLDTPFGAVSLYIELSTIIGSVTGLIIAAILSGLIPVLIIMRESIIKTIWGN
jgi:putative ABC transport system permease protein